MMMETSHYKMQNWVMHNWRWHLSHVCEIDSRTVCCVIVSCHCSWFVLKYKMVCPIWRTSVCDVDLCPVLGAEVRQISKPRVAFHDLL